MPYIQINTAQKLSPSVRESLKSQIGRLIAIIPTKSEAGLMVDFSDGHSQFKAGTEVNGVFVDLRLYKQSPFEAKKQFTEEMFRLFGNELGIKPEHMTVNIIELENWGVGGSLK
jgi:phenylpyruvate tautomerase PptA (4-oxalocrotonate tautomerase family)